MVVLKDRVSAMNRSLSNVAIFAGLPQAALADIAAQCTWKLIPAKQTIVHVGDQARDVFFLVTGEASVIINGANGRPVAFRDFDPGHCFGEFSAIDGAPRSADVKAKTPCLVAQMSAPVFIDILQRHPAVAMALLVNAIGEVRHLTARVFEFSTLAVRNRLHAEILRLARKAKRLDPDGAPMISPAPKHLDIASRISTHREAVTKELAALTASGIVERRGKDLAVCNLKALQRLVDGGSAF